MTQTAIRLTARVLPGQRLEVHSADLKVGSEVELIVFEKETANSSEAEPPRQFRDVIEFLDSLPPSNLTREDWERIEREFREEREAWGD